MIVYPRKWRKIGVAITATDVERRLVGVLKEIDCNCLSFSGGIDSSLLLYHMCQIFDKIKVFTIGLSMAHPDVTFAQSVVAYYGRKFDIRLWHYIYCPEVNELKKSEPDKVEGDTMVRAFYKYVAQRTNGIIAGDVIDEYTCGYYTHMNNPNDEGIYYDFIRRLQREHLVPLNENSGGVEVYLPYADEEILRLLSQIPLKDKVDLKTRKKITIEMAKGKVPDDVILRRKYGFCDALTIKGVKK